MGWKRFVRGMQVVPGTRGKDLDIAFSPITVRHTLTRWFNEAVSWAADAPGDVLVVIAGDGLNPTRHHLADTWALFQAHRRVVTDPRIAYLRIQHAQGTHLSWMKDFLSGLRDRPRHRTGDQAQVSVQFEAEHGASVNVVMVGRRDPLAAERASLASLEGWTLRGCAVVLSDLEATSEAQQIALLTGTQAPVNPELLHFGRAHCEGLLLQAATPSLPDGSDDPASQLERRLVGQIARWIERVRLWGQSSKSAPRDVDDRGRWVARRLGLADARLARALAREMERDTPPNEAAMRLWDSVPRWPGDRELGPDLPSPVPDVRR